MTAFRSWVPFLLMCLASCGQPADLERARSLIDSAAAAQRVDSLRQVAVNDSLRDGMHAYRDRNGLLLMEGEMLNGRRHGVWTSYDKYGKVKSRNEYANGVLNGLTTVYHPNGSLRYSGDNRNGHPTGDWRFFDGRGKLAKTVTYDTSGAVINDR